MPIDRHPASSRDRGYSLHQIKCRSRRSPCCPLLVLSPFRCLSSIVPRAPPDHWIPSSETRIRDTVEHHCFHGKGIGRCSRTGQSFPWALARMAERSTCPSTLNPQSASVQPWYPTSSGLGAHNRLSRQSEKRTLTAQAHTHTHAHTRTNTHTHTHTHAHNRRDTHTNNHTHAHIHMCTQTQTQ